MERDNRAIITDAIHASAREIGGNRVHLEKEGAEITLFEPPLIGFAKADDPLLALYKDPAVIGEAWMSPKEWMPEAQTVVSMFFPFTDEVRSRERKADRNETSEAWLYGRIEGQEYIVAVLTGLRERLSAAGFRVCVPALDKRMKTTPETWNDGERSDLHVVSAWSERHAAFACGLGTFGLSRGIITEKGMAGRLASLLIDAHLQPDPRRYTEVYEYCIRCGACARRCPVDAITPEHGKNNMVCKARSDALRERYAPRYGCGKCQTLVPCEFCNPKAKVDFRGAV